MSWIDGDRWDSERGPELVALFVNQYMTPAKISAVVQQAGIDPGLLEVDGPLGVRWLEIAKRAVAHRQLRLLVDVLIADSPALAVRVDEIAADPAGGGGNPADVYAVQILARGRPLIDRQGLRDSLRNFLTEEVPLMVIRGKPRTGKSFSYQLIQHVTRGIPSTVLRDVDFSSVASGNDAAALMSKLCLRLGVPDVTRRENFTTGTRFAAELVDAFIGQYQVVPGQTRIVVIDGLNRQDLKPDVADLVAKLAVEVIRGQLPQTQLVLTGYSGGVDRAYQHDYVFDEVEGISPAHVFGYFENLVLPNALSDAEIEERVTEAFTGDGDLESLADRVRKLTLDLLAPAGGNAP